MLISCPECKGQVSTKASICPHCGYRIPKDLKNKKKRMRLPNGFGRIVEIKGQNLRKPFRAMISVGKDENGRPIGKILKPEGYFATYNEAYQALMNYHNNPYNFSNDITLGELYERWFEEHSKKISASRIKAIKSAWKYLQGYKDDKIQTMRQVAIKKMIMTCYRTDDNGKEIYPTDKVKSTIKSVLIQMMDYAVENEIIEKNYARDVKLDLDLEVTRPHEIFTKEEVNIIKERAKTDLIAQMILIQCYTGFRPDELCCIEVSKVNMTDWVIIGGAKTKAGKNRMVPIHKNIRALIQEKYNQAIKAGSMYLFNADGQRVVYHHYLMRFVEDFKDHRPHDCRKHFVTIAKKSGVDEYAIKRIVGHAIKDITESIYTDRDISWMHEEIAKIRDI
mgnify:CR=1 FL=1